MHNQPPAVPPGQAQHRLVKGISRIASGLGKALILVLAIWAFNVAFVAVHELGHMSMATCVGAKVCNIYISPMGYNGATSFVSLSSAGQTDLVFAGGLLSTIMVTLILYLLEIPTGTFIMGIRTTESLLNLTPGSDMSLLMGCAGQWSYLVWLALTGIMVYCVLHSAIRGMEKYVRAPVRGNRRKIRASSIDGKMK